MPNPVSGVLSKGGEFLFGEVGMSHRFTFSVDKSPYDLGSWSKVTGLDVSWTMCRYRSFDNATKTSRLWISPGTPQFKPIRLSRAACSDSKTVQEWLQVTTLNRKPLSGGIAMLDWMGTTIVSWEFSALFPCAWSVSDFDAGGAKPLVETLDIAHTGFIR
jgi:phage tail-like protein